MIEVYQLHTNGLKGTEAIEREEELVVYVKNIHSCLEIQMNELNNPTESIWVTISGGTNKHNIGVSVYYSPTQPRRRCR